MKERSDLLYIILPVAIIAGVIFFLNVKNREVNLCRQVFNSLANNGYPAERFIDWKNLKALDTDVGVIYARLPNEKEKTDFKKSFFANFSAGFKQRGGNIRAFTNWRISAKESGKIVVAADYSLYNKTILFGLSKSPRPLLISIQWE